MNAVPSQSPATINVSLAAIHEVAHFLVARAVRGDAGLIYLTEGGGGRASVSSPQPWGAMLIHAAGISGTSMVPPFTRTMRSEDHSHTPTAGIKTGREALSQIDSNFTPHGLPSMTAMPAGASDEERAESLIEDLATAGRIQRRNDYQLRWWSRARSRAARFLIEHRGILRYLALQLEVRRALSAEEIDAILAENGYSYLLPIAKSSLAQRGMGPAAERLSAPFVEGGR